MLLSSLVGLPVAAGAVSAEWQSVVCIRTLLVSSRAVLVAWSRLVLLCCSGPVVCCVDGGDAGAAPPAWSWSVSGMFATVGGAERDAGGDDFLLPVLVLTAQPAASGA